jgi:hypothetical protein
VSTTGEPNEEIPDNRLRCRPRHRIGIGCFGAERQWQMNSNIGSSGAHTGTNGDLHSDANARINATKGSHRSANGLYNSTRGGTAAHTGMNGKLHSSGNKAINTAK